MRGGLGGYCGVDSSDVMGRTPRDLPGRRTEGLGEERVLAASSRFLASLCCAEPCKIAAKMFSGFVYTCWYANICVVVSRSDAGFALEAQ